MSIYIDGRDCCQTGQFSQDVADGALTTAIALYGFILFKCACFQWLGMIFELG
ncbi:general secretion pathway protein L [Escherichia coli ATCC BAA-2219]|nr:general secretion pathway protein L [Escherichia coli ATCC BAA-2219]